MAVISQPRAHNVLLGDATNVQEANRTCVTVVGTSQSRKRILNSQNEQ